MLAMSLDRVLEPEAMDSEEEASDYDAMDHGAVNARFCDDFLALSPALDPTLDIGTGTAQIPIALCRRVPDARVTAIDLADSMLALGAKNVERAGLSGSVTLQRVDAKTLPYRDGTFASVISNSIVHHIPDPGPMIGEALRVLAPGGVLFVRDLMRPETDEEVRALVAMYAGGESERQRALFDASLRAALTLAEVRAMARAHGVPEGAVAATSDRHWTLAFRANKEPA
jgi:ubiquinone/menaquinone biosynthesis C-methylase UbiE